MPAVREPFGTLPDGTEIELIVLRNGAGMEVALSSLGATVQSLVVDGVDVVLGYALLDGYLAGNPAYFGGIVCCSPGRRTISCRTVKAPSGGRACGSGVGSPSTYR